MLMKVPFGYVYHKLIIDEQGKPADNEFLEVKIGLRLPFLIMVLVLAKKILRRFLRYLQI